nr:EF-hand and coiled-coil domain-containing protein 1-like [Lytechinus pictus]
MLAQQEGKMHAEDESRRFLRNGIQSAIEKPRSMIVSTQRSQWLTIALSHAYSHQTQEPNISNEIIVLSTGIDQYIQEIFFHLGNRDHITNTNRDGGEKETISWNDFYILCQLLGADEDSVNKERGMHDDEIGFQDFHSRLINIFAKISEESCKVDDQNERNENRWKTDDEMVEAGINIPDRKGLLLRQMCTECFHCRSPLAVFHSVLYKQGKIPMCEDEEHYSKLRDGRPILTRNEEVATLRAENNCLREVVEDMRRALQTCDAKCLAMTVEITKINQSDEMVNDGNKQTRSIDYNEKESTRVKKLVKEMIWLRESRDKQLEEAILFTQQMEAELWQEKLKNKAPEKCDKG